MAYRGFESLPLRCSAAGPAGCDLAESAARPADNIQIVGLPISKSELERLGFRLISSDQPEPKDLFTLRSVLDEYGRVLDVTATDVGQRLGVDPTPRVKSLGTTLDKLRRNDGSGLRTMQDLAGMRIVKDFGRVGQDHLCNAVVEQFREGGREPKVIDRRETPAHGYRAVHVVLYPEGLPVEVQIRTRLQDDWANLFEKLADRIGRGIRYGEPPDPAVGNLQVENEVRAQAVRVALKLSEAMNNYELGEEADGASLAHKLERVRLDAIVQEFGELIEAAFGP